MLCRGSITCTRWQGLETMLCVGFDNPAFWKPAAKTPLALVGKGRWPMCVF